MTKKEISLTLFTEEQKMRIWKAIENHKLPEDRDPEEVIADEPYNGDKGKYLQRMAEWYGIAL